MRIAIVPSNQHHNVVAGDPNPAPGITTEEQIAVIRGLEAMRIGTENGHTMYWAYIPGVGASNVDELVKMLDKMMLWKPDYVLSMHSDANGRQDVYPLICRAADAPWADKIGIEVANRIGFAHQYPTVRTDLAFCRRIAKLPPQRGVLLEVGVHGGTGWDIYGMDGPTALWVYARFHGIMAMRGFLKICGLLIEDGPIPDDVPVPPGFEYWHEDPAPPYTRMLKVTDPYMRGEDVRWVQEQLVEAGFNPGTIDGIYGPNTETAVIGFQKKCWPSTPSEWDGIVGPKTWNKLLEV